MTNKLTRNVNGGSNSMFNQNSNCQPNNYMPNNQPIQVNLPENMLPCPPQPFNIKLDFSRVPLLKNLRGYSGIMNPCDGGTVCVDLEGNVEALNGNVVKAITTTTALTTVTNLNLTDGSTEYDISVSVPLRVNSNTVSVPLKGKTGYNFASADNQVNNYGINSGHFPVIFYSGIGSQAGEIWASVPGLSPNNYSVRSYNSGTSFPLNIPSGGTLEFVSTDDSLTVTGDNATDRVGYKIQLSTAVGNQAAVLNSASGHPGLFVSTGNLNRQYKVTNYNGASTLVVTPANVDLNFKSLDNSITLIGNDNNDEIGIGIRLDPSNTNLLSVTNNGLFAQFLPTYINTNANSNISVLDTDGTAAGLSLGSVAVWDHNTNPNAGVWVRRVSTSGSNQWQLVNTASSGGGAFSISAPSGLPQNINGGDNLSFTNTDGLINLVTASTKSLGINLSPDVVTANDSINKLADVTLNNPQIGQAMVWNGSGLVNQNVSAGFNLQANSGPSLPINNADSIRFEGMSGITTSTTSGSPQKVSISLDVRTDKFSVSSGNTVVLASNPNLSSLFLVFRNGALVEESISGSEGYIINNNSNVITFIPGFQNFGVPAIPERVRVISVPQ